MAYMVDQNTGCFSVGYKSIYAYVPPENRNCGQQIKMRGGQLEYAKPRHVGY